ncbi:MAG TPA: hypothetical protein VK630_16305, partial [Reyranella sp.]|nr:hypothetical protein [Reyranella sp.]
MKLRIFAALMAVVFARETSAQTREQAVRIPAAGGASMIATVVRPPGEDKKPLVVINHGSPADGSQRGKMAPPRYNGLSSWFVSRGYVVVL